MWLRDLPACVLVAWALAACGDDDASGPGILPFDVADLPTEEAFLSEIDRSKGWRDCFTVIRDPTLVPASRAPRMKPDELVLGLDLGEVQAAYPINYLNHHEIVEQTLEGLDLLVVW